MQGIVQPLADDLLGRADGHGDHRIAQLDLGLVGLDLDVLVRFVHLGGGLGVGLGHDALGQALAALDGFLDLLALDDLDVLQLELELALELFGLAEVLLGLGVIVGDGVATLVQQVENRTPRELAQHPDEEDEPHRRGQQVGYVGCHEFHEGFPSVTTVGAAAWRATLAAPHPSNLRTHRIRSNSVSHRGCPSAGWSRSGRRSSGPR